MENSNLRGGKDDTANQDLSANKHQLLFRNQLFNTIVNEKNFWYAALLIDDEKNKLFCGQVCEIINSFQKNGIEYFLVVFTDFLNEEEILECLIEKEHFLPLFYFDPPFYEKETQEARNKWEEFKVHHISTLLLKPHKKSKIRFQITQLVTLQLDFEQKHEDNKSFFIQAGQVGVISKILDDANVEVTFRSIPLGILAVEKQMSVYTDVENLSITNWKKKFIFVKTFFYHYIVKL
jgi:hypothetical protein